MDATVRFGGGAGEVGAWWKSFAAIPATSYHMIVGICCALWDSVIAIAVRERERESFSRRKHVEI